MSITKSHISLFEYLVHLALRPNTSTLALKVFTPKQFVLLVTFRRSGQDEREVGRDYR